MLECVEEWFSKWTTNLLADYPFPEEDDSKQLLEDYEPGKGEPCGSMLKDYIGCWLLGVCVAFSFLIAVMGLGLCIYQIVEHLLK